MGKLKLSLEQPAVESFASEGAGRRARDGARTAGHRVRDLRRLHLRLRRDVPELANVLHGLHDGLHLPPPVPLTGCSDAGTRKDAGRASAPSLRLQRCYPERLLGIEPPSETSS